MDTNVIPGLRSPYEQESAQQVAATAVGDPAATANPVPGAAGSPGAQGGTMDFSQVIGGFQPAWNQAMSQYGNIPGLAQQTLGYGRIWDAMNQVANQRAAMGINRGTEAENLRGNVLSNLAQNQAPMQANLMGQRNALLGLGLQSEGMWANMLAQLIRAGYTG